MIVQLNPDQGWDRMTGDEVEALVVRRVSETGVERDFVEAEVGWPYEVVGRVAASSYAVLHLGADTLGYGRATLLDTGATAPIALFEFAAKVLGLSRRRYLLGPNYVGHRVTVVVRCKDTFPLSLTMEDEAGEMKPVEFWSLCVPDALVTASNVIDARSRFAVVAA